MLKRGKQRAGHVTYDDFKASKANANSPLEKTSVSQDGRLVQRGGCGRRAGGVARGVACGAPSGREAELQVDPQA